MNETCRKFPSLYSAKHGFSCCCTFDYIELYLHKDDYVHTVKQLL
jgi:hypothetical protein